MDESIRCYIGIDVSKSTLDVHISPSQKNMRFANSDKGIAELIKELKPLKVALAVCLPSEGKSLSGTKIAFTRIPDVEEFLE